MEFFEKTMRNMRKHRDIKPVTNEKRRNYLASEQNYYTTSFSFWKSISNRMKKTEKFMNKPVYWGLSILELNKRVMYEFWYGYVKPKYGEKAVSLYT